MKSKLVTNKVSVKQSVIHGFGVFAEKPIRNGEVIEECHTIFASATPINELNKYVFNAGDWLALPLGFGCIYNHSDEPNAIYLLDKSSRLMTFKANRFIEQGEEIFISYGNEWFSDRSLTKKTISNFTLRRILRYFFGVPFRGLIVVALLYTMIHWLR